MYNISYLNKNAMVLVFGGTEMYEKRKKLLIVTSKRLFEQGNRIFTFTETVTLLRRYSGY